MSGQSSTLQATLQPRALNVEGAVAPEWIELIPAGQTVQGSDGRSWANGDPAAVVAASLAANRPLPVDWEHATEVRAPKGEEAPAAAWIEGLEVRDGAVWGKAAWTPRAANQVANKEYRFVSPVFTHDRAAPHQIRRLVSVALTNTPNLHLHALNRAEGPNREPPETTLDLVKLRQALGLAADASDDAIIAAATEAKASNSQQVDLTRYAPRADLETALNRANTAETALATIQAADRDARIETALNKAQTEGKITPATRPEYLAMCKVSGVEAFERLAALLPVIASGGASTTSGKPPGAGEVTAANLTDEQRAVCRALGQDEAEFAKSVTADKKAA